MTSFINLIVFAIMTLASLVMAFIGFIDGIFATLMTSAGIPPNVQLILLAVAAVMLAIFAIRALGGLFAGLIIVLLALLVLHQVFPKLNFPHGHTPHWLQTPPGLTQPTQPPA